MDAREDLIAEISERDMREIMELVAIRLRPLIESDPSRNTERTPQWLKNAARDPLRWETTANATKLTEPR